jgi:DNA-binding Lrp family transcriptional regulator
MDAYLDDIDLAIITLLRQNSRTASERAAQAGMDAAFFSRRVRELEERGICGRHVSLVDASKLGIAHASAFMIRTSMKSELLAWLIMQESVDRISVAGGEFDFYIEALFKDMSSLCSFIDGLSGLGTKQIAQYHIVERLHQEKFLGQNLFRK